MVWYIRPGDYIVVWPAVCILGGGFLAGAVYRYLPQIADVSDETALYWAMAVMAAGLVLGLVMYIRHKIGH